jgi:cell division control protein CDC15
MLYYLLEFDAIKPKEFLKNTLLQQLIDQDEHGLAV